VGPAGDPRLENLFQEGQKTLPPNVPRTFLLSASVVTSGRSLWLTLPDLVWDLTLGKEYMVLPFSYLSLSHDAGFFDVVAMAGPYWHVGTGFPRLFFERHIPYSGSGPSLGSQDPRLPRLARTRP